MQIKFDNAALETIKTNYGELLTTLQSFDISVLSAEYNNGFIFLQFRSVEDFNKAYLNKIIPEDITTLSNDPPT